MVGKVAARKAALREKLIDLAEAQIEAEGLASLRARDLAKQADCAVGAIYTHFDDLNALVLEVNGRTFSRLREAIEGAMAEGGGASPNDRLITMSIAYLNFAIDNPKLWRALFEIEDRSEGNAPDWYLAAMAGLFAIIQAPVAELFPDRPTEERDLITRTLFSSVHGIIWLGLENWTSAVPPAQLARMITFLLNEIGKI